MTTFSVEISESSVIPEVLEIRPSQFIDHRGSLWTSFEKKIFEKFPSLCDLQFVHDKFARNNLHVLRGIHGDWKSWKLVTCLHGHIFQVVVDNRPDSKTYLRYVSYTLNSELPLSLLIPPGFGNAFVSLSENSLYHYKLAYLGDYSDADQQFTVKWDDPKLNIVWPVLKPVLSERDNL